MQRFTKYQMVGKSELTERRFMQSPFQNSTTQTTGIAIVSVYRGCDYEKKESFFFVTFLAKYRYPLFTLFFPTSDKQEVSKTFDKPKEQTRSSI